MFYSRASDRIVDGLTKSQAIVEFHLTGKILRANDTFCRVLGYTLQEIQGQTGEALDTIVSQVNDVDLNVRAVVESARNQSIGLKEINEAVISMDQGTQQNTAMVEGSTAASHALASEVAALNKLLEVFQIGDARSTQSRHTRNVTSVRTMVRTAGGKPLPVARAHCATAIAKEIDH